MSETPAASLVDDYPLPQQQVYTLLSHTLNKYYCCVCTNTRLFNLEVVYAERKNMDA